MRYMVEYAWSVHCTIQRTGDEYEKRKQMAFFLERIPKWIEGFQMAVFCETELQKDSEDGRIYQKTIKNTGGI